MNGYEYVCIVVLLEFLLTVKFSPFFQCIFTFIVIKHLAFITSKAINMSRSLSIKLHPCTSCVSCHHNPLRLHFHERTFKITTKLKFCYNNFKKDSPRHSSFFLAAQVQECPLLPVFFEVDPILQVGQRAYTNVEHVKKLTQYFSSYLRNFIYDGSMPQLQLS